MRSFFIFVFVIFSQNVLLQGIDSSVLQNLSPSQISEGVKALNQQSKPTNSQTLSKESTDEIIQETLEKNNKNVEDINLSPDKKYGYSFIESAPTSISAIGDLPLPNEYKISIRDRISIILSGSRDAIFDLPVQLDGSILFPELGSILVVGKTLGEVKNSLSSLIKQSYVGVQIDISLSNLSAKKISIVGAVKMPGTYLVNPFSTITNALSYSGGISEIGTLRNIKLKRINGEIFTFDLYKLLIDGERKNDITIESGDVIIIEAAKQFVKLSGSVVRPAIYEIKGDEKLEDLINFGLGFQGIANRSNISLEILDINRSSIESTNTDDLSQKLDGVLSVNVFPYVNKNLAGINVIGAVKEPGFYELKSSDTLKSLLDRLDFMEVYPWLAVLEQFDKNQLIKSSTLFNLNDPETYQSIKLLPNSKLYFANVEDRTFNVEADTSQKIKDYELRINHKQDTYSLPVIGKFSVDSFINLLGLDMTDVNPEATYISPLESLVIKKDYKLMNFRASKYNTVSFRSPINDLITVKITGAVDYPGNYVLESKSSLDDLYNLIGNFKEEAFNDGIILTRATVREQQLKSIRKSTSDLKESLFISKQKGNDIGDINVVMALSESIEPYNLGRISGNFSPDSTYAKKMTLRDGDEIFVPKIPNVVSILGEVLNPSAISLEKNINIFSAISSAGGFKDYADRDKIYVIKANGLLIRQKRSRLSKVLTLGVFPRSLKIEAGDTIVVPRKIITTNPGLEAIIPITQVLSNLAFAAAAIDNLRDN